MIGVNGWITPSVKEAEKVSLLQWVGPRVWVTASHLEEARHLLYTWREQKRRRQTDGKLEPRSCGNGDFKVDDLAWGAGKRSIQNKWEVNTQPQEAINCSEDQLGLSRCSWPPALVLPHLRVCDGALPCPARRTTVAVFSFAQQFEGKRGGFQGPLLRPLYPPPTKCKSLERAITSSRRGSAFTGGGDKTGSLSCETPPPSMLSLNLIALFTPRHSKDKTVKIKVNHCRGSRRATHNHRKLHLLRKNKKKPRGIQTRPRTNVNECFCRHLVSDLVLFLCLIVRTYFECSRSTMRSSCILMSSQKMTISVKKRGSQQFWDRVQAATGSVQSVCKKERNGDHYSVALQV